MEHAGPEATLLSAVPAVGPSSWQADAADASRAANGDFRAFERLYRSHVARVHSLARRMLNPDEASEATQDVFVRAWQKIGQFRGESAFGTWLHRVAVNVLLARRRVLSLERERTAGDETTLEQLPGRPGQSDLSVDFEAAIALLPNGARQVFVMHDVEGYKHEEIAEMLGVTTGTTKAQLHRARMLLRGNLTR
ncbi:MAG: RNA polymerase sigma factor [Candidatus Eiseniibacteriota bacterium]